MGNANEITNCSLKINDKARPSKLKHFRTIGPKSLSFIKIQHKKVTDDEEEEENI